MCQVAALMQRKQQAGGREPKARGEILFPALAKAFHTWQGHLKPPLPAHTSRGAGPPARREPLALVCSLTPLPTQARTAAARGGSRAAVPSPTCPGSADAERARLGGRMVLVALLAAAQVGAHAIEALCLLPTEAEPSLALVHIYHGE